MSGTKDPRSVQGQHIEASTKLKCKNVTDRSIFIEGLQDAGLQVELRTDSGEKDLNRVLIAVQSQEVAHQIVKALDGFSLQGRRMHIEVTVRGTQIGSAKERLPKKRFLHKCIMDAFSKRASKKGRARERPENAVATQKAHTVIEVPDVAIKKEEVDDALVLEKGERGAMRVLDAKSGKPDGFGKQIVKQEGGQRPYGMRGDSLKPEPSTTQQTRAGEIQSDLRGEKCQIQDTARLITPARSPTPEDFLSALLAYLDEGKDAVIDKPKASTQLTT